MSKFIKLTLLDEKDIIIQVDDIEQVKQMDNFSVIDLYGMGRCPIEVVESTDTIYRLLETKQ